MNVKRRKINGFSTFC